MINNWYVMSAREAQDYCKNFHENKSIIISINNSFESPIKLTETKTNKVVQVLVLSFDDVLKHNLIQDPDYPHIFTDEFGRAYDPISRKDAEKIHDFVIKWEKSLENIDLIVHCEMGVSRSSAVMAAILKGLYNDDMPIYKNGKYRPNPDVYRAVYSVFEEKYMEDNMLAEKVNLRYNIKDTPVGYCPDLKAKTGWNKMYYVPSSGLCEKCPDAKEIIEEIESWGSCLPYNNFTFAVVGENETLQKGVFISNLTIDSHLKEYNGEDSNYKDTVAWKIVELHKKNWLPDITVTKEVKTIDGIEYEIETYKMLLYNLTSPFFYQKSFDFYTNHEVNSMLIELEYSVEGGYKTWGYYSFPLEECKAYRKYISSNKLQVSMGSLMSFMTERYTVTNSCMYNKTELKESDTNWYDVMFLGIKGEDDDDDDYKVHVFAQNPEGDAVEVTYSLQDWNVDYPNLIGIRIVDYQ